MSLELSTIRADEYQAIAQLIHSSLVNWYEANLHQGAKFGDSPDPFVIFPEVYETLDPGEAITARDKERGTLLGVCFVHPRETHHAIGIVATATEAAGRGIARAMMQEALKRAEAAGKPVRLVSSLLNLDSFSLYTRLGFVPRTIYQDLLFVIPETGLAVAAPADAASVREAKEDEAARLADFELSLQGVRREQDYDFFLKNKAGQWKVLLSEDSSGNLKGVLVISFNAAMPILGPGVIADEETALGLLWAGLNLLHGKTYLALAPASASGLVRTLYSWGARNVELHVAQAYGDTPEGKGISFPTFLPESA